MIGTVMNLYDNQLAYYYYYNYYPSWASSAVG